MRQSVVLGTAAFVLVAILCRLFAEQIVSLFFGAAEAEVKYLATQYFRISALALPFLLVNTIISGNMRGAGNMKAPMFIAGMVNILNLALGVVLIFGLSLPEIGVRIPGLWRGGRGLGCFHRPHVWRRGVHHLDPTAGRSAAHPPAQGLPSPRRASRAHWQCRLSPPCLNKW